MLKMFSSLTIDKSRFSKAHQSDLTIYCDQSGHHLDPKGKVIEEWYHDKVTNKLDGSIGQLNEWRKKAAAEVTKI
ncbi:hypothetical protein PSHT_16073 [Puccinia striiformis]|nr:hypothetical protein PSHT_16073 [Puccinia striiformis]